MSWRRFGQNAPQVWWCMICMYFLNKFGVCQLCKILYVICKHILGNDNKKSATFYDFVLVFKHLSQTFWLPLVYVTVWHLFCSNCFTAIFTLIVCDYFLHLWILKTLELLVFFVKIISDEDMNVHHHQVFLCWILTF